MIVDKEHTLLYIEPDVKTRVNYSHGVLDNLTQKLFQQLLQYSERNDHEPVVLGPNGVLRKGVMTKGFHTCHCGWYHG